MSGSLVILCYLAVLVCTVFLLWRFSHVAWYWHVLAFAGACILGVIPPMRQIPGPMYDLIVGSAFLFLLIYGVGEPVFRFLHLPRHA